MKICNGQQVVIKGWTYKNMCGCVCCTCNVHRCSCEMRFSTKCKSWASERVFASSVHEKHLRHMCNQNTSTCVVQTMHGATEDDFSSIFAASKNFASHFEVYYQTHEHAILT